MKSIINTEASSRPYQADERKITSLEAARRAMAELSTWPQYAVTPLRSLAGLAKADGLGAIFYKDEATRFGLDSFKALGGAYAAGLAARRLVVERFGVEPPMDPAAWAPEWTSNLTLTCATDGNHGRSVAFGAVRYGCQCVVYMHERAPDEKAKAIEALGATVIRTPGSYDDSVRVARAAAAANPDWLLVPDTTNDPNDPIPAQVMQGYGVMSLEIFDQLPGGEPPTHVFVQGGVGGLAAAIAGNFAEAYPDRRPFTVVVEPEQAACLLESARLGRPAVITGDLDTNMAMLSCGEASPLAWTILKSRADAFMVIDDATALEWTTRLVKGEAGDPALDVGISGAAGLAGLQAALADPAMRAAFGLNQDSRVLVVGTEAGF